MQIRLTDTTVASLRTGEYWDTILPAFGVRVGKRRRTFLVNHEHRRKKLGTYPQLSLKEARQKAADVLDGKVARTDTLKDAVEEYLHLIEVRSTTLDSYQRFLRKHLVSELGARKLSEVETRDILKITDAMKEFPSKRQHAYVAFKVFFRWCARRDYIDTSPMQKLDAPVKTRSRSRVLTDDELVRVWKATEQLGVFGSILQLAMLTGQRRGELAQIKISWIQDRCLVIPGEVAKNDREHRVPLTNQTEVLCNTISNKLSGAKYSAWSKSKAKLDTLSGTAGWTIHDVRRTFATNLARLQISPVVIERLLNHAAPQSIGGTVGAIYNRHSYQAEMKEALDKHEAWLLNLIR